MPGGERWRGLPSAAEAEANRSGFTARLEVVPFPFVLITMSSWTVHARWFRAASYFGHHRVGMRVCHNT
jgi:hypothetical protein